MDIKHIFLLMVLVLCPLVTSAQKSDIHHHKKHYRHGGIVHHYGKRGGRIDNHRFAHHDLGRRWEDRHKRWALQHQSWRHGRFQRYWWHGRWWGPGWSRYPWYWLTGPVALRLRLAHLAQEDNWDEIYYILNREIDHTDATANRIHTQSYANTEHLRKLRDQKNLLESYIQDADMYRGTRIEHSQPEQHNEKNTDVYTPNDTMRRTNE